MELKEALSKAGQILAEERSAPTVKYEIDAAVLAAKYTGEYALALGSMAIFTSDQRMASFRAQHPRPVQENPREWTFKSINYNLLCALHAQIAAAARPAFVNALLLRMATPGCALAKPKSSHPSWHGFVSEFPLIAEFCVRNGASQALLETIPKNKPVPGQALLLQHMEEMIALNFTVFSDAEFRQLEVCARGLCDAYNKQFYENRASRDTHLWEGTSVQMSGLFRDLGQFATGILEECRKARYLYLKGSLLEGLNLEINQDKDTVQTYLQALGFTETLAKSLDEVERHFHKGGTVFDLKASMGHLRSFLEGLHGEVLAVIHKQFGGALPSKWGDGLAYLRNHKVLSGAEEGFAANLYTIISDRAVHPLVAEREYARLFRNVVIEYSLLLLHKLKKLA
jgi:hypothetical protein